MNWIILGIIISVMLFVVLGIDFKERTFKLRKIQFLSPLGLLIIVIGSMISISANSVGIVYNPFGSGVSDKVLGEGFRWKSPLVTIYELNTETVELNFTDVTVQTADSQWVNTELQIQTSIDKNNVLEYFRKYRNKKIKDIDTIIQSTVQKELEAVSIKYNIMEILGERRNDIINETLVNVREELAKDGINVNRLILVDTEAGNEIESAIAKEAAAKKEAETAKYLKEKATLEGEAKVIEAEKQKEANELLSKSITKEILIEQYLNKWDGKLPLVSSDGNIIDISSLLE